ADREPHSSIRKEGLDDGTSRRAAHCKPRNNDNRGRSRPTGSAGHRTFQSLEKNHMKDAHASRQLRSIAERRRVLVRSVTAALVGIAGAHVAVADHEGLPFTEPFDDAHLSDASSTTADWGVRSEEHTSELQSRENLVCRLLL